MANKAYAPHLGTSTPGTTGAQQQVVGRLAVLCVLLIGGLLVAIPAYMPTLQPELRQNLRLGMPAVLLLVTLLTYTTAALKPYGKIALAYFAVSLALALDRYVGDLPLNWLGWSANTPQGAAMGKIGECVPIILAILLFTRLGGEKLSSLYLRRGQLGRSLALGLGIGAFCLVPFVLMGGLQATLNQDAATILSWLPWLVAFSLANGFMEELWFRGSWMSRFGEVLGPRTASPPDYLYLYVNACDCLLVATLCPRDLDRRLGAVGVCVWLGHAKDKYSVGCRAWAYSCRHLVYAGDVCGNCVNAECCEIPGFF